MLKHGIGIYVEPPVKQPKNELAWRVRLEIGNRRYDPELAAQFALAELSRFQHIAGIHNVSLMQTQGEAESTLLLITTNPNAIGVEPIVKAVIQVGINQARRWIEYTPPTDDETERAISYGYPVAHTWEVHGSGRAVWERLNRALCGGMVSVDIVFASPVVTVRAWVQPDESVRDLDSAIRRVAAGGAA